MHKIKNCYYVKAFRCPSTALLPGERFRSPENAARQLGGLYEGLGDHHILWFRRSFFPLLLSFRERACLPAPGGITAA